MSATASAPRITTILEELARPNRIAAIYSCYSYEIAPTNPEVLREMIIEHLTDNFPRAPFLFPLLRHLFQLDSRKLLNYSALTLQLPEHAVRITFCNTNAPSTAQPLNYCIPDLMQAPPTWLATPPTLWSRLFGRL
jgi:hypothetical protein